VLVISLHDGVVSPVEVGGRRLFFSRYPSVLLVIEFFPLPPRSIFLLLLSTAYVRKRLVKVRSTPAPLSRCHFPVYTSLRPLSNSWSLCLLFRGEFSKTNPDPSFHYYSGCPTLNLLLSRGKGYCFFLFLLVSQEMAPLSKT